jgi:hypothetical protein
MSRQGLARKTTLAALSFVAALGVAACGPEYDRTELSGVVADDFTSGSSQAISVTHMQVHEGLVMKSHIVVWNDNNVQMHLDVRSSDPDIVEIAGVITPRDYAFIGRKVGHTQIKFVAEDTVVLTIEADVLPQPTPAR